MSGYRPSLMGGKGTCILLIMEVVFAESNVLKKDLGAREVGSKLGLKPRDGGQRMIYEAHFRPEIDDLIVKFVKLQGLQPGEIAKRKEEHKHEGGGCSCCQGWWQEVLSCQTDII